MGGGCSTSAIDPLEQGRINAARGQWNQAADGYASYSRILKHNPTDGHFLFEYAALSLLSGDRSAYTAACSHMVEAFGKPGGPRAYHVARACTLAPDAVADAALPGRLAATELRAFAQQFWSLTEQGALLYRAGRFKHSVPLFEQSLQANSKPGAAVVNWIWLALADQRLGKNDEALRWLEKAQKWLDQFRDGVPANAEVEYGLHLHNWLEANILRREAEALITPQLKDAQNKAGRSIITHPLPQAIRSARFLRTYGAPGAAVVSELLACAYATAVTSIATPSDKPFTLTGNIFGDSIRRLSRPSATR
jgi:tetratricopeptide (TPR) repeat protein